jgi:hypothetical protein
MSTEFPRAQFLLSLGSLSLAACSSGSGVVLPKRIATADGGMVNLPDLSIVRTAQRTVSAFANGRPIVTYNYDEHGLSATNAQGNTVTTAWPSKGVTVGQTITDGHGRSLHVAPGSWKGTSALGKSVTVKRVDTNKSLWSFETTPKPVNFMISHDFLTPDSRLTRFKDYVMKPGRTTATGARSAQDFQCYQYSQYFQGNCGSMACGTWYVTSYCTGTAGGDANSNTGPTGGSGGNDNTPQPDWKCVYQMLLGAGILTTTMITEDAFLVGMAIGMAGVVLTGPVGWVAALVAALTGLLLTVGIAALDYLTIKNLINPCLPAGMQLPF